MTLLVTFLGLGVLWAAQLLLTWQQVSTFMAEVRRLRALGTTATGVAGRRYRGGRAYVSLAATADGVVAEAVVLRGRTVGARPRRLPALVGLPLASLVRTDDDAVPAATAGLRRNVAAAAAEAARSILEHRASERREPAAA